MKWKIIYGTGVGESTLALRFKGVVERACMQSGERVVHRFQTGGILHENGIPYLRGTSGFSGKSYRLYLRDGIQIERHGGRSATTNRRQTLRPAF